MEIPGRSPRASASRAVEATEPTGASTQDDVRGAPRREHPDVEAVDASGVAGGHRDGDLRRDVAERGQVGQHAQDAERDDARARRRVVADDHAPQPVERVAVEAPASGDPNGLDGRPAVAAVDDLDRHVRVDDALDVRVGHRASCRR